MGGKVLDYEAKTIYMDGKNDGIALGMAKGVAQGMAKGVAQGRASLVLDMIKGGLEIGTIREFDTSKRKKHLSALVNIAVSLSNFSF